MISRRSAIGVLASPLAPQPRPRPDIVLVVVDDLRHDALGYAGHLFARTPNIDALARESAVFTNAFVTTPLCSPSRASLLTGQYAHRHRITGNSPQFNAASHKLVTFPKRLHDAGYETAYVGKWHMGNDDSPRPGFDRWVSFRGQGQYLNPALNADGASVKAEGYMTDVLNDHAAAFLRRAPAAKPLCLVLAHKAVHGPFTPADRHKTLFENAAIARSPGTRDDLGGKPVLRRAVASSATQGPAPPDEVIRNQMRCLASVDDGVSKLVRVLRETRRLDNTIFIFTSDNGYFWGEHGLGDKRAAYDVSIRVPLLIRYPKRYRAGARSKQLVLNVDLAPTVLELAGLTPPGNMQGLPLSRSRSSFLVEYFEEPNFPRIPAWQAVRSDRWKYIHYTGLEGMDEIYDLHADPYEMKNLIVEPHAQKPLRQMQLELQSALRAL